MKSPITNGIRSAGTGRSMGYSTSGGKEKRTLGIEEDGVVVEVWPLEYALQFRYILLPVRRHCESTVSTPRSHPLSSPAHTLLVITDEHHLPQRRLVPGQYGQVIPGFYLTRFVDDDGLDRDEFGESTSHEPSRRQHAGRAQHDPNFKHATFVVDYCVLELRGFDHPLGDGFV